MWVSARCNCTSSLCQMPVFQKSTDLQMPVFQRSKDLQMLQTRLSADALILICGEKSGEKCHMQRPTSSDSLQGWAKPFQRGKDLQEQMLQR